MNSAHAFLLGLLGLLAASRPAAAQQRAAHPPPSAGQRYSEEFPGQIRPAETAAEATPALRTQQGLPFPDAAEASDLELGHLQHLKNKVALGVPLTKAETLFMLLWMQRFPVRPQSRK